MFHPRVQSKKPARLRSTLSALLLLVGCHHGNRPMQVTDLDDPDVVTRIRAMKWAGKNKVDDAVGALIDNLAHEDPAVRLYAIGALVAITGKDQGYDYKSSAVSRAQAIDRWREVYQDQERNSGKP